MREFDFCFLIFVFEIRIWVGWGGFVLKWLCLSVVVVGSMVIGVFLFWGFKRSGKCGLGDGGV